MLSQTCEPPAVSAPPFRPGFRLSAIDVVVLLVAGWGVLLWGRESGLTGYVITMAVGHFFLFCNVVRMRRACELLWAASFIGVTGATLLTGYPGWTWTTVLTLLVTVATVGWELRQPDYHGLGWQWINPGLPARWSARWSAR